MNLNYPKTSRFVSWRRNVISSIYVSYHMARLYNLFFISWMVDCSCCCRCCYKYRSTHSSNQNLWRTMSRCITWKNPDDLETLWGYWPPPLPGNCCKPGKQGIVMSKVRNTAARGRSKEEHPSQHLQESQRVWKRTWRWGEKNGKQRQCRTSVSRTVSPVNSWHAWCKHLYVSLCIR